MSKLSYRIFCWFAWKHPVLTSRVQEISTKLYIWRWHRYMKRHRSCCEDTLAEHCANKLWVNTKKACCYGYLPDRCKHCGRRIPRKLQYRYMMLSSFMERYEEERKRCRKAHR